MAFSAPLNSIFGVLATPVNQPQLQLQHPAAAYQQQQQQQQVLGQTQNQVQTQHHQGPQNNTQPHPHDPQFQTPPTHPAVLAAQAPAQPPLTNPQPVAGPGFPPAYLAPGPAGSSNNPSAAAAAAAMPNLPYRSPSAIGAGTKTPFPPPRVTRTLGQRPSCLVNATLTYCGDNQIYAFGGFDQYTDEVYNQVRRLDLVTHQWTLVDNYGDIPGVRMGHTATLYQGSKLLVFGGENEHRNYLSDLIVFDTKTAHWTQPQLHGTPPTGRARHAAVIYDDKLFIMGGISGLSNYVLDDICFLDLRTFTWSRSWRFVPRFDHAAHIHDGRVWVFGGLDLDSNKAQDLWWMDIKGVAAFDSSPPVGSSRQSRAGVRALARASSGYAMAAIRQQQQQQQQQLHQQQLHQQQQQQHHHHHNTHVHALQNPHVHPQAYAANSGTAQVSTPSFQLKGYSPQPPAPVSSLSFQPHSNVPPQGAGTHFHAYSSSLLLDFMTPNARTMSKECSLYSFDLAAFKWQQLAVGPELFKPGFKWHYVTLNEDRTRAWLLGCPDSDDELNHVDESLSDILEVDLRRYGILGSSNGLEAPQATHPSIPQFRGVEHVSKGLSADLARLFDTPPEAGSGADFVVTAAACEDADILDTDGAADTSYAASDAGGGQLWQPPEATESAPIHVHRIMLQARWPHFNRVYGSQMREFHSKKMHIPEPYPIVRAFLHYLYTDSIHGPAPAVDEGALDVPRRSADGGSAKPHSSLAVVSGLLVLSNLYMMPHLRHLCVHRLSRELDIDHACLIWYRAGLANEDWLRRRAANFCMQNWGRVVRTRSFAGLPHYAIVELSQATGTSSRVFEEDEMEDYVRHREREIDDDFLMG